MLLTFFDFPAEHWKHLRTRTWSSRRSRRCAYGSASRKAWLSDEVAVEAYKLLAMAQVRWRRLDGAHHLPLVRAGSLRETQLIGAGEAHGAEHHSFAGVRMGAPLAFSSTTTNLAGSVLLALRPTT